MPNPLMGNRLVTSRTNVDRPTAIEPVPENYAGDNNPYRGIQNHGVKSDNEWRETDEDMPDHDGRLVPVYEKEDEPPDPVPVYIVNQAGRERRSFRSIVGYATGTDKGSAGAMIIGQDESRTRATIRNKSIDATLWVGDSPETSNAMSGYPLTAGETYATESQEAIYATVDKPEDMPVFVAVEYRVSLDG